MTNITHDPAPLFTASDTTYRFARWGRPIAPVVFGVGDESLPHLKDAISMTVGITGGPLAETDPELGANFMWFFCREWDELSRSAFVVKTLRADTPRASMWSSF